MSDYTVHLSDSHEKALEHLRFVDGGGALDKPAFVQHYIVRALENHALTIRDRAVEVASALSDEDFAALPAKRQAALDARKAAEEARLALETKQAEARAAFEAEREAKAKADEALVGEPKPNA